MLRNHSTTPSCVRLEPKLVGALLGWAILAGLFQCLYGSIHLLANAALSPEEMPREKRASGTSDDVPADLTGLDTNSLAFVCILHALSWFHRKGPAGSSAARSHTIQGAYLSLCDVSFEAQMP